MPRTQINADQILDGSIVDDDIATTAAIQLSKLGTGNLTLINQGSVIFKEQTGNGTDSVTIEAPDDVTTSYILKLPVAQSTGVQFLQNDGSGNLSWNSSSGGATTALDNLASVAINTTLVSDTHDTDDLGTSSINWRTLYLGTSLIIQEAGAGTDTITIGAPAILDASWALTLPVNDGDSGQVLTTNGSGVTSWSTPASSGATVALDNLSGVAINTALLPGTDNSIALGSSSKRWTTVFAKDIKAGASGTAGTVDVFPSSATTGKIEITATSSSGDTTTTITNASQAGARTYTILDAGTSANFVMSEGTATINGAKTFSSAVTINPTTNQLVLGVTNTTTISSTAPAASRTYTIPDAGSAANMVLDKGNYTIGGTWSFSNSITLASTKALVLTDNSTNTVTLKATNSTTSYTLQLPTTAGTSAYFLQTDGSGNTTWQQGGGVGYREDYVVGTALSNYTGSTTVFNLVNSYNVGGHTLIVTLDGDVQTIGATVDYLETNSTTVTFNNALISGEKVSFIFSQPATSTSGNVNSGTANQLAYYATSGTTVSGDSSITTNSSNQLLVTDGTVSLPGYSFSGDVNTGLYRIGADDIALATNGIKQLEVSTTAITAALPLVIDTGATPSAEQFHIKANGLGNLGFLTYSADNVQLEFDSEWTGNADIARSTSAYALTKVGGVLNITGDSGLTSGNSFSKTIRFTISTTAITTFLPTTIKGTTTNDSAAAGYVGEYVESVVSAVNSPSSGAYGDLTSISLTAGDWDVTLNAHVSRNGATVNNNSAYQIGVSQTTGNSSTGLVIGSNLHYLRSPTTADNESDGTVAVYHQSLNGTTTIYAKFRAEYASGGPPQWDGRLSARRVR
jgi:hypothetical protein